MSEIVNLKAARKARAREAALAKGAENRVRFGRSKAQKAADKAAVARSKRQHDQARREP